MKAEGVDPAGVSICAEWSNSKTGYIGGAYPVGVTGSSIRFLCFDGDGCRQHYRFFGSLPLCIASIAFFFLFLTLYIYICLSPPTLEPTDARAIYVIRYNGWWLSCSIRLDNSLCNGCAAEQPCHRHAHRRRLRTARDDRRCMVAQRYPAQHGWMLLRLQLQQSHLQTSVGLSGNVSSVSTFTLRVTHTDDRLDVARIWPRQCLQSLLL